MQRPLLAALALVAAAAAPARADEGESALSVSLGYASFAIPEHEPPGGAVGLEYERGLSDVFWLRAAAAGGVYGSGGGPSYGAHGSLGLTYVVDVLKYVPYLHAGLGGVGLFGGELDSELHPVAELGAGLDILARRDLSWGPWLRLASFLDDSQFVSGGVRLSWRWGYF
ncbi:MAG TPA: hypothetical protein VFU21_25880 [Kofleriaceae bacterium]|nr:hypothetical protein [Kofleriaceae bacterium]